MKWFIIVLLALNAHATGIFTLKGQLKGFTETTLLVQKGDRVYEIKKSELPPEFVKEIIKKKSGSPFEAAITTTSVKSVTQTKKN